MNRKPTATEKAAARMLVAMAQAAAMTYVYWATATLWAALGAGPHCSERETVVRLLAFPGWIAGNVAVVVSVVWCTSIAWRWVRWALTTPVADDPEWPANV